MDKALKTISLTVLLYGREYLGWALKSIVDYVDEVWVLYSDVGSHGFRVSVPCPESRVELHAIASAVAGNKLRWVDGQWWTEGQQREAIYALCPDAERIIVVDADEIWPAETIHQAVTMPRPEGVHKMRIPMVHFWRSFKRAILHDPSWPQRIIYPGVNGFEDAVFQTGKPVCHMGYAQTPAITKYKTLTHGHRRAWKKHWLTTVFLDEDRRIDLHPVGSDAWNAEDVNPLDYLPEWMNKHPFYGLDIIK